MRLLLPGGLELDDDTARVDVDAVHRYLSEESYWAAGRPRDVVVKSVREATRVIGLYDGPRQVGFARVVSDDVIFAFLADVYVLAEYRGRGLGVELVREAVENGPQRHLRWFLGTRDAHGLYAKFAFGKPSERFLVRPPREERE